MRSAHATNPGAAAPESGAVPWLPDFCSLPVIAAVLLLCELVLLVILIAPDDAQAASPAQFVAGSIFALWLGLCSAVALCLLRTRLGTLPVALGVAIAYSCVLAIVAAGSALVFLTDQALATRLTLPPDLGPRFVLANTLVAAIVTAAAFRYFYVRAQWQRQVRAQAKAQLDVLQARIRPHFLFNSMNTIASLIRSRPQDAERAVEDLSDLFRAALAAGDTPTPLAAELELVRRYLDIERLRLGERLHVDWQVDELPPDVPVPALLLQPLAENAVLHGIQPLPDGGTVSLRARREGQQVVIELRNPAPERPVPAGSGRHLALDNIRRRLAGHFGDRARLEVDAGAGYYACRIILPAP